MASGPLAARGPPADDTTSVRAGPGFGWIGLAFEGMQAMHVLWPRDPDSVKGVKIEREAAARVWRFAAPYRAMVVGFLLAVVVQALLVNSTHSTLETMARPIIDASWS